MICIDTTLHQIEDIKNYFGSYRNEGFAPSIATIKNIASQMGVEPSFPVKRQGKRKKHFDDIEYQEEIL
jgi:ribosomal protein S24E